MDTSSNTPDPMYWISEGVADLGVYLALWDNRDKQPTAAQRAAASQAIERIDATLQRLHRLRSSLVTEVRHADDETMRRTEELLERLRREREADDQAGPGYTGRIIPPIEGLHDSGDDNGSEG